jgi:hypothetical protein
MRTNATDFFDGTVLPTVEEFFLDICNLRRARLAVIVLFHMSDYWKRENPTSSQAKLIQNCPDFLLVRDAANATKHGSLTKSDDKNPRRLSCSEDMSGGGGIFDLPFGEGVFAEAVTIVLRLDDASDRPILPVIRNVMKMWTEKVELLRTS